MHEPAIAALVNETFLRRLDPITFDDLHVAACHAGRLQSGASALL
jgi:hypothetical protein